MSFWIVMEFDSAILGFVSGEKSSETIAGPFETYDEAIGQRPRKHDCTWYAIKEADHKPAPLKASYRFVDADREFDDV
tara:strand:+ start:176 stop:409 length:234 start_codon:yes stop_codon:yes gene_type:complete